MLDFPPQKNKFISGVWQLNAIEAIRNQKTKHIVNVRAPMNITDGYSVGALIQHRCITNLNLKHVSVGMLVVMWIMPPANAAGQPATAVSAQPRTTAPAVSTNKSLI
jgi:hypothetical protein